MTRDRRSGRYILKAGVALGGCILCLSSRQSADAAPSQATAGQDALAHSPTELKTSANRPATGISTTRHTPPGPGTDNTSTRNPAPSPRGTSLRRHRHDHHRHDDRDHAGSEQINVRARAWEKGSYTIAETRTSTGLPLSLRETPQTVTVISRQLMDDQQINTLDDVLGTAPGVSSYSNDNAGRTTYRARGFDITNYRIDGMQIDASASFGGVGASMNMDLYENAQIVRGANGLMGGTGDPSATIYLQRKAPTKEFTVSGLLRLGNWNEHRVMADVNVPMNHSGTIRSRYVFSWDDTDTFRVREHVNRLGALANYAIDLSPRDTLNYGFQYERTRNDGASWGSNVPIWFADGKTTNLPRSTNPVANWSTALRDQYTAFANYDHSFGGEWHLKVGYMRTEGGSYNNLGVAKINNGSKKTGGYAGFWNEDGTGAYLNALHAEYADSRDNADVHIGGPFRAFGRTHQLVFGFNGYNDTLTTWSFSNALGNCSIAGVVPYNACQYRATGLPIANWRSWNGDYSNFQTHRTHTREVDVTRNYGAYTSGRFVLAKGVSLVLGGRVSTYEAYSGTYTTANVYSGQTGTGRQNAVLTPYAGAVWDFTRNLSLYGSYTNVYTPQSQLRDANNQPLSPVMGKSYETGIKGAFYGGRLNTTLAFYLNRQNNVAQATGATNLQTGESVYESVNGVKTEGVDFDASGEILPGWNVLFGYSYLNEKGLSYRQDPQHLVRLTTSYTFHGRLKHLTIGGGISSQTSTQWATNPGRPLGHGKYDASNLTVNGYTLVNLMARYRLMKWLDLTGNITNLTDKTYVRQAGFYDGMIYGQPRTFSFTLRGHY